MDNKTQKSQQKSRISSLIIARGESSEGRGKSKIHIIMVLGEKKPLRDSNHRAEYRATSKDEMSAGRVLNV